MFNFGSMKYILVFCFLLALSNTNLQSQTINFRPLTLEEAVKTSAIEKKPVLFMAYQATCGHCEKMLNEVFIDTALANFYNKTYICVKEDLQDTEKAKAYLKRFYITSFPTFIILNSNAELLYQFVGEFKAEEFINQGRLALDPKNQIPTVKAAFDKNTKDSTACYNYLLVLSRGRLQTQSVANMYFHAHDKNPEVTPANWKIFSMSVSDMGSEVFKYMIANKDAYAAIVTQKKVDRKIYLTAAYNLQSPANANDTLVYFKNRKAAEQLHFQIVDSLIFINDLNVYEKNKMWDDYMLVSLKGAERFVWNDANVLRRICDVFNKNASDPEALKKAVKFAERAADLRPEYYNFLAAANLYLKAMDKTHAKEFAIKAKELGLTNNMNVSEANLVLTQCEN